MTLTVNEGKVRVVYQQNRLEEQLERSPEDLFGNVSTRPALIVDFTLGLEILVTRSLSQSHHSSVKDLKVDPVSN